MIVVSPNLSVMVSIWMETLVYGMNVIVYGLAMYTLVEVRRHAKRSTKYFLVITSTLLFAVITVHMGINFARLIEGYVNPPDKLSMTKYLLNITEPSNIAKTYLLGFINLFSDILIIWRVYMVWERNRLVALFPTLLALTSLGSSMTTSTFIAKTKPGESIFAKEIQHYARAQLTLQLAMNISATALIIFRIWWVTRTLREHKQKRMMDPYWRVIKIVVESAALAAFAQTVEMSFYYANFPGVYFVADTTAQIIALNPLLIIAFIGQSKQPDSQVWTSTYDTPQRRHGEQRQTITEPVFVVNEDSSGDRTSLYLNDTMCSEMSEMKFSDNEKQMKGLKKAKGEERTRSSMNTLDNTESAGIAV